jgi:hypothetical protein
MNTGNWRLAKTHGGGGNDQGALFARNLAQQEVRRWQEFLARPTQATLTAWRNARSSLRRQLERMPP